MSAQDFDPDKFINCELEHQIFSALLTFPDLARVLAIRGPSGTGKSHLLLSFAYQCRITKPRVPVCLISLDQPGDAILPIIQDMARQLSVFGLDFPTFKQVESARVAKDFGSIRSAVYLEGASFKGANDVRISSMMINPERVEHISISATQVEFTPEQTSLAQEVSINAFFHDLRICCTQLPVVLLLDTYEKSRPAVRAWINDYFLERLFFDFEQRPQQLIAVIAGQDIPPFRQFWSRDTFEAVVHIVPQLSAWERHHIEACVQIYELGLDDAAIDAFHRTVRNMHLTPALIVNIIQTSRSQNGRGL